VFLTFQETAWRHPVNTSADSPLDFVVVDDRDRSPTLAELRLSRGIPYVGLAADDDFQATSGIAAKSIMEICPEAGAGRAITDRGGHNRPNQAV
jgi:hypothetical protein